MSTATVAKPKGRRRNVRAPSSALGGWAPRLANGYRLSQPEFHRRYEQLPEDVRAELIEGLVFMSTPLSVEHARATKAVLHWLAVYETNTPGVEALNGASLILDTDNEFQPDCLLRLDAKVGGDSRVEERYLHGSPELVVEVSLTSVAQDLGDKFKVYRRHGIREYVVWQLQEQRIDWFVWQDADYVPLKPNAHGLLCSRVFPGLWLDAVAMLAGGAKMVLSQLQKGLESAEHRQFLRQLAAK
jgi:Uma2 family endonuclease